MTVNQVNQSCRILFGTFVPSAADRDTNNKCINIINKSLHLFLSANSKLTHLPDCSATLDRLNELKLSRTSLKYLEVIFKVTFSLTLPWWLLKFPGSVHNGEKEMRVTEKLCTWNWPAAFELRANFNWDKLTSRTSGHAPKRYPKWRRPMMNLLLLWRGISLGSDALWKLKQLTVTQLSVVFLLVSTKNIQFPERPSPLKLQL